ncbi:MAG: hypothetical protein ACO20Y_07755 [Poseidonia sp.]
MEESRGEDEPEVTGATRIGMLGFGLFLFFFGLPFAFAGGFTLLEGLGVLPSSYGFDPFLVCFSIPFLGVGVLLVVGGLTSVVGGALGKEMGVRIGRGGDDEDHDDAPDREHDESGRSNTAFAYISREALLAQIHGTASTKATPSIEEVQTEEASTPEATEDEEASPAEVPPSEESTTVDGGFWNLSKDE